MDRRIFDLLFKQLCAIATNLQSVLSPDADIHRMWYGPRGFFLLAADDMPRLDKLIRDLLRHSDWNDKFSPSFASKRLREIMETHAIDGDSAARLAMEHLMTELGRVYRRCLRLQSGGDSECCGRIN